MNIYGISLEKLEEYLEGIGEKKFHAKQIFRWLYDKRINRGENMGSRDFSDSTKLEVIKNNLSKNGGNISKRIALAAMPKMQGQKQDQNLRGHRTVEFSFVLYQVQARNQTRRNKI